MAKLYYTIGETADILSENVSCVRYWTGCFPSQLSPHRNAKGNRLYTETDIEALKRIKFLLKDRGLTIEGAQKALEADSASVDRRVKAIESLQKIREQLKEIRRSL